MIERRQISIRGIAVDVVRKAIKNLHLGVYPPHGRVRVAAPLAVTDEAVRLAVIGKLGWIKRQRARFDDQPRQSKREMVSGESHYFLGQPRWPLHATWHGLPAPIHRGPAREGSWPEWPCHDFGCGTPLRAAPGFPPCRAVHTPPNRYRRLGPGG